MKNFSLYYIEANLVCVIIFSIILYHNFFNIDRQEKQTKFDNVLIAFILYFLTDCVWAAVVDGLLPKSMIYIVSFLIYIFMVATIYTWFNFVMAYEQVPGRESPKRRLLILFPYLVSIIALIIHLSIAPQTLVNDQLETQVLYNILYLSVVPNIYMIAIFFYAISRARKEENPVEKRKHLFIGFFPLLVSVGGVVQASFPYTPIYCFTCLILMLVFYIDSIEDRISLDPLTGLNNRGQLNRYCSLKSNLYLDDRLTVIIIIDVNKFKSINDTYGHAEGDKALIIISDALKKSVNKHSMPSFICRYGGDEFVLIVHPVELGEVRQLISEIREEISRKETAYPLSVSVGYETLGDSDASIQECFIRADKKLYKDKEASRLIHDK